MEKGESTSNLSSSASKDYSKTNIQVSGVDEADIIKTDGDYIYALSNDYLNIIKVDKDNMEIVSKIKSSSYNNESSSYYIEMYINNNKLIVIKSFYKYNYNYDSIEILPSYGKNITEVHAVIFDITDKSNPKKINELSQTGNYVSSRLIDNYLYVITDYYVYNIDRLDIGTYIPMIDENQ